MKYSLPLLILRQVSSFSTTTRTSMSSTTPTKISIQSAGFSAVNGFYTCQSPHIIPKGFKSTCEAMNWDTQRTWNQLSSRKRHWFLSEENDSYVYWNKGDGKWWIDGPDGAGIYIVKNDAEFPPNIGWMALDKEYEPCPIVEILEKTEL